MLDLNHLLTSVATNAMGVRGKSQARALDFLGGSRGSFLNTSTLIGLAGLAAGAYQVFKDKSASSAQAAKTVEPGTTVVDGSGRALRGLDSNIPPIPKPPPLTHLVGDLPMRAVRVMIAAARCDGQLGEEELGAMITHAKDIGLEKLMRAEWQAPRTLAEICKGVSDPEQKRDLYVLAFTVLRADDDVSGAERVFLTQLAAGLALTPDAAAAIERDIARKIDRAG